MLVAIFQTTEQSHFHNGLAIKLQRIWLAFYPSTQRRGAAKIVIEIVAEDQRLIPLLSGIPIPVSVGVIRRKQGEIIPCPTAGWRADRTAGGYAGRTRRLVGVR